jgi:hypothetical protein
MNPWSSTAAEPIDPKLVIHHAITYCERGWFEHTAKDDPNDVALARWYLNGSYLLQAQLGVVCRRTA